MIRPGIRRLLRLPPRRGDVLREELDEEIRLHLELRAEQMVRQGLPPDAAEVEARRRFGRVEEARRELYREAEERERRLRLREWLDSLRQDVRFALRTLVGSPAFTVVAVLTLALGIGANTAVFGVVDAVLLRPLPYAQADRLLAVWTRYLPVSGYDFEYMTLSWPELEDYRRESRALAEIAAYTMTSSNVTQGAGEPQRVPTVLATANLFRVLGVRPQVGRGFAPGEDRVGSACTVVLGHALWSSRFGADPGVVGRALEVDGEPCTVLGVMPRGFGFPSREFGLWRALVPAGPTLTTVEDRESHWLSVVARLAPGATLREAEAEARGIAGRWERAFPEHHRGHFVVLQPARDAIVGSSRTTLLVLLGAVTLVLVIVCANLANLLLVRGEGRRQEMAVRLALGAARGRLVRQLLTESLVLSLAGGAAGLVLAAWLTGAAGSLESVHLPRAEAIALDGRVLLFNLAVSLGVGVVFGLAPALQVSSRRLQGTLRLEGRTTTAHAGAARARRALIGAEIGLAVVLVTGAALLARSFVNLQRTELGFEAAGVTTAGVALPAGTYAEPARVTGFFRELRARLAAAPGVAAVGAISDLPLASWPPADDFVLEGSPPPAPGEPGINGGYYLVTPGALEALRVPLLRGRPISESDVAGAPLVALVNRAAALRFWAGRDPVGQRIHYHGPDSTRLITVVGVVGDTRYRQVQDEPRPAVYVPHAQLPRQAYSGRNMSVVVRTAGGTPGAGALVRGAVHDIDPSIPVDGVRPMSAVVAEATGEPRFLTLLMGGFAGMALLLGALGVYGVVAYTVRQRVPELGIRLALGATPAALFRLVVGQGIRLALGGVAAGVVGALLLGRVLEGVLYGVTARDPLVLAGVAGVLLAVVFAASALPARRASRIDTVTALRS